MISENFKKRYFKLIGKRDEIEDNIKRNRVKKRRIKKESNELENARDVIKGILEVKQESVSEAINGLTSACIAPIYGPENSFRIDSAIKKNGITVKPVIVEGDIESIPRIDTGCGMVDMSSYGIRLSLLSLSEPAPLQTVLMDEPFRFLGEMSSFAAEILRETNALTDLQMIIITHDANLIPAADRLFNVKKDLIVSNVSKE